MRWHHGKEKTAKRQQRNQLRRFGGKRSQKSANSAEDMAKGSRKPEGHLTLKILIWLKSAFSGAYKKQMQENEQHVSTY